MNGRWSCSEQFFATFYSTVTYVRFAVTTVFSSQAIGANEPKKKRKKKEKTRNVQGES